ncbi:MAG: Uncharacterized protein FD149_2049 [Rhodospirillaceae bacterium]|nr:MAG: Uncharacterized protein FD149_2049 [Rhodospirillaceae bacterium]
MGSVCRASPLPDDYWRRPLAPQGEAPATWSPAERALAPAACGTCHVGVFADWQSSVHAKAFSPGLVGQLLTYSAAETQICLDCHAPLAEQAAAFERARAKGQAHWPQAQGLAAAGNGCGGCHVRERRRFGPPQRETGKEGPEFVNGAHGGVIRTKDFEQSDFCASCHQFPQDQAINGKPLENTVEEWRHSPHAAAGRTCQSCHMPDRRHLWRGIHDPAMVASGVRPDFLANAQGARFTLTNTGVGHAFPTYVTPKVIMHAVLLDGTGRPVADSARSHVIERRVVYENDEWREIADTRLLPGESASVEMRWGDAQLARVWLEVRPDEYYHVAVYAGLLDTLPAGEARHLIAEADARAQASPYVLFETVLKRNTAASEAPPLTAR